MTRRAPGFVHARIADIHPAEAGRGCVRVDATAASARPIRIVIADEHALDREGLRVLLDGQVDFRVSGEAADAGEVLAVVRDVDPDVLLMDSRLPKMSAFDVLDALRGMNAPVQTIILAARIDPDTVVNAIQRGGRGIFLKSTGADLLFKSIRCVHEGQLWISHSAVAQLVAMLPGPQREAPAAPVPEPTRDFGLTARERDVLRLIVDGETNKGIAAKLSVGQNTVKHHLTNIFNKTGASSRLELAVFALHHGLVSGS